MSELHYERLARYRQMATRARESARRAQSPETQAAFIAVATAWENLAAEVERLPFGAADEIAHVQRSDSAPEGDH